MSINTKTVETMTTEKLEVPAAIEAYLRAERILPPATIKALSELIRVAYLANKGKPKFMSTIRAITMGCGPVSDINDVLVYEEGSTKAYRCECGCNVFKTISRDRYECNSCHATFKNTNGLSDDSVCSS